MICAFANINYDMNRNTSYRVDFTANSELGSVADSIQINQGAGGVAGVPEPATWAMMLLGFGGLGSVLRSRRARVSLAA